MIETLGPTKDGRYPNLADRPREMRAHNALAAVLAWIGSRFERISERFRDRAWDHTYCKDCGENLYYGRTCRQVLGPKVKA